MIDASVAELVLPPGADRARWLAARRTGVGGSDVSTLVGLTRYTSPYELWLDKTGALPLVDDVPSEAAEMGQLLEPVVRDRFARVHHLAVTQVGTYRSREWPWMLANPDGVCSDGAGYEGKTCSHWVAHEWADGQTADHAELQAQWGMAVTGLSRWHVAVLIAGQRNEYRVIERDDELIGVLVDVSRRFWHDHVRAGVPPEWGGSDAATTYLKDRYSVGDIDSVVEIDAGDRDELAAERDKAAAALKAAEAVDAAVRNRVRGLLGDREQLVCGDQVVATWTNTGRFLPDRFMRDHPELVAAYTEPVTADVIDVDRLAADHPDIYRACRTRVLRFTN
ncbi:YqaJ viral recombinase family protein [Amycolatopsis suaedae]|uniref:YqaJ viral recombinase family nuclease n=1 Tax=Amycolatopsis suaedae TaxID=2510978 RepID=UPI0013EF208F|nr:YqaJ viral recombinase family protein [Amycolatopsis suaedae]